HPVHGEVPARRPDHAQRGYPVPELCHAAQCIGRPDPLAAAARMVRTRLRGMHPVRRGPCHGRRRRRGRAVWRDQRIIAGPRGRRTAEPSAPRPRGLCLGDRRHGHQQPRLRRPSWPVGGGDPVSRPDIVYRADPRRRHCRHGTGRTRAESDGRL
ncbi:hypothetical protein OY671_012111, partial [Metschnikowia pulcherrima]